MMEGFKEYKTKDLIIYWKLAYCSHSGKCTSLLPQVFDVDKRPWITADGASPEEIIQTIDKCPSGALRYRLPEGSKVDPEAAKGPGSVDYKAEKPSIVHIRMVEGGPLLVKGPAKITDPGGKVLRECESMVLCRCGLTKNPPFCDGSHRLKENESEEKESGQ